MILAAIGVLIADDAHWLGGSETTSPPVATPPPLSASSLLDPLPTDAGRVDAEPANASTTYTSASTTYTSASTGYELRPIPAGTFIMGSPASEANHGDETQHEVTLTHAYLMGKTEVTQKQWETVMGSNPSEKEEAFMLLDPFDPVLLLDPSYPVQNVSWCDSVVFANKLSEKDGLTPVYGTPEGMRLGLDFDECNDLASMVAVVANADGYRLPTEAEWERAARGGTADTWAGANREADLCSFANIRDVTAAGRFRGLSSSCDDHEAGLTAVGSYIANSYGLYDMSGNVYEWTWDVFWEYPPGSIVDPTGGIRERGVFAPRVVRGGAWSFTADSASSASRGPWQPGAKSNSVGLRLARTIP